MGFKTDASQQKEQYYLCGVFVLIVIIATAIAFYSSFKDLQRYTQTPESKIKVELMS